ncbi:sigma factor-like helix-turn-helix DNA-binding protein [Streptomyces noursei]|uniref:sigma factor-like helix-turn-helix DNA-binding protein n=1 Tax=Streptomyces noursei TaxID=1971 RepID=UPI0023B7FFF4|nr:sigma factor-like helix-turn-helix DNA-binding protein [Streptomyces noursei]
MRAPAPFRAPVPGGRPAVVPPAVTLPPAFEALYALHGARYLGYALAHVAEPAAARVLGEAMGEVAIRWADIVRRPNPAACAWTVVSARIRARSGGTGLDPADLTPGLFERVGLCHPALEYDAFVLHDVLGYSVEETAEAMGAEVSRVRYALLAGRGRGRPVVVAHRPADALPAAARNTPHE